eukprot:2145519-Amphidinium_carterae.1
MSVTTVVTNYGIGYCWLTLALVRAGQWPTLALARVLGCRPKKNGEGSGIGCPTHRHFALAVAVVFTWWEWHVLLGPHAGGNMAKRQT